VHNATGETTWEYPSIGANQEQEEDQLTSLPVSEPAIVVVSQIKGAGLEPNVRKKMNSKRMADSVQIAVVYLTLNTLS